MIEILILALMNLAPHYVDRNSAEVNVNAAVAAAKATGLEPELLLAIGYAESRFNVNALSRIQCVKKQCRRVTGVWVSEEQPPGSRPTWYCGVTQVGGNVPWSRCRELMTNVELAYQVSAEHLRGWMRTPLCLKESGDDRMVCALRGYGGGFVAIRQAKSLYPYKVMSVARMIKRLAKKERVT